MFWNQLDNITIFKVLHAIYIVAHHVIWRTQKLLYTKNVTLTLLNSALSCFFPYSNPCFCPVSELSGKSPSVLSPAGSSFQTVIWNTFVMSALCDIKMKNYTLLQPDVSSVLQEFLSKNFGVAHAPLTSRVGNEDLKLVWNGTIKSVLSCYQWAN